MSIKRHFLSIGNDVKLEYTSAVHAMKKIYFNNNKNTGRTNAFFGQLFFRLSFVVLFWLQFEFSCHPWMGILHGNWFCKIAVMNFRFDYFICFIFGGRIRCAMPLHFKCHGMCIFIYHYCFFIRFICMYVFVLFPLCVCMSNLWHVRVKSYQNSKMCCVHSDKSQMNKMSNVKVVNTQMNTTVIHLLR